MLRITKIAETPSLVTLRLEGRIASDWVTLLEQECLRFLQEKRKVLLDFSGVTFVDGHGVEMLKRAAKNLQVINCPPLIEDLLKDGGNR